MSDIRLFALGGLGENGKNMYCLDVNNKLFVLDAGLKYPSMDLYGVDSIIPDFSYLERNKERVVGIFLSHGHEDHIGAVPKLLKSINAPVYGSNFTLELVKDALKESNMTISDYQLFTVDSKKVMTFDDVTVDFYEVTHSIPEALGMAFNTPYGTVVYAPDYSFDQNVSKQYRTNFKKLSTIASRDVVALMTESLGAENSGYTHSKNALDHILNQTFYSAKNRIIVSAFSTDLVRIQKVIDLALKYDRNIAIIGRKTQRTIDIAINNGYLKIPKDKLEILKFISEDNKNELKNTLVLVAGDRHEPFYMLQRMVKKQDRLIHITKDDTIILMTPPVPGTEKIAAQTVDLLYRFDTNVVKIDKKILQPAHASSEDIKLLINILDPKFILPIIGEDRHQIALKKVAKQLGYTDDQIIILENGQILDLENNTVLNMSQKLSSGDLLVDGILDDDLSDVVMRDREILAQDGAMLIICNLDARHKKIMTGVEIVSRGFVFMKENEDLIQGVKDKFLNIAKEELQEKYINWRQFKDRVKKDIGRYLYYKTKRNPIIIPVLIDTQLN
ncbi:MAG: ribonuclease J [Candidatus Izimaplasma sp.]|nr:ribonuclease J [Candidatus Izimaplasma bacterium]